ncbi:MAG: anti-sigma factor [Acidobacteriota bacterium]
MTCSEVQRILTEDIQQAASGEVQKHLESCQACRELERDLLSLQELSGGLKGRTHVPAFFAERVCSRASGRSRAAYWSLAATAVGLILLVVAVANLAGLSPEGDGQLKPEVMNGGERIKRIEHQERAASPKAEPDVFYLGSEEWGSQETDVLTLPRSHRGNRLEAPRRSSAGYVLELPATIEVRQTQADNEFYLENVSH